MADYRPMQQQAYERILEMIRQGKLAQGVCYSEKKLAAELNMSRTPVRDAIMRLSQDKYIEIIPSKGFCLHTVNEKDVWNTFQARTAIEGFCAIELHRKRDSAEGKAQIRQLERNIEEMADAIEMRRDYESILSADFAFHHNMVSFSGNEDLEGMMETYHHRLSDIAFKSFEQPGRPIEALKEHKDIFHTLTSDERDAEVLLYQSVMKHMESSRDIALRLMKLK